MSSPVKHRNHRTIVLDELDCSNSKNASRKHEMYLKRKEGHEKVVERLQRKIVKDAIVQNENKTREIEAQSKKLKQWIKLVDRVKEVDIKSSPKPKRSPPPSEDKLPDDFHTFSPRKKWLFGFKKLSEEKKKGLISLATIE